MIKKKCPFMCLRAKDVYKRQDDILIHKRGVSHVTPHRYMLQSGNEKDCIDVAILAEG